MLISHSRRNRLRERIRRFFGGMPARLQVAALPWRRSEDGKVELLLVTSRGTGRWVVPKGWQEKREEPHLAAAREAGEEAGVSGTVSPHAIGRFFYSKAQSSGLEWRCEVRVYPLEVEQIADTWPEAGARTRRWFSPHEAAGLVDEPDLGELIARFDADRLESAA